MSGTLNNSMDNSEVPIRETEKTAVGGYFQSITQAEQYKLYLENLKLMAEIQSSAATIKIDMGKKADGTPKTASLPVKDLLPKESEWDRTRRIIIAKLNKMPEDELRPWMARFETDDIFLLSSRITTFIVDGKRREKAKEEFNIYADTYKIGSTANIFA